MRITENKIDINYEDTKEFFRGRSQKFNKDNPYSVTMYQDNNKELVLARNAKEIERLYPLLCIDKHSKVLDVACGIGRWADTLPGEIEEYCGIDFSAELIEIARQRNRKENFHFCVGGAEQVKTVLTEHNRGKYNIILMIGIMVYLNDTTLTSLLVQLETVCENSATICIREPIALKDRLTLKNFFSDELNDNYNAIYRTRSELLETLTQTLLTKDFSIKEEGFLFDEDTLNNRKETAQYYFLLKRN
ncbi:MAG: class I SAM-dependent methyltransferase [Lachnospiraceae bacterium]|nr:class I SAM-dependent methyltransferase [Lachnospiraceae bacterium]MCM1233797.1 class I SAM-dependent methyltransferase [Ruminococcus flavefaciens]